MSESNAYLKPEILGQITRLGLHARQRVEGTLVGRYRSPLHGVSPEFAEYREYVPGDDPKNIDWRAYARSNRHYIKRFEEESNLRATLVVDTSASMRYQGKQSPMSKFDTAATVAMSLANLLINQRDAVGLITFDTEPRTVLRPQVTQKRLRLIHDTLIDVVVGGETDLGATLSRTVDRIALRGMVIIISDFLGDLDSLYTALGKMQFAGHELVLLQILDRDELELPFKDSVIFKDIEGTEQLFVEPWAFRKAYKLAMQQFVHEIEQRCHFCGMDHLLIHTDDDLGLTLSHYLHQRLRQGTTSRAGHMSQLSSPEVPSSSLKPSGSPPCFLAPGY